MCKCAVWARGVGGDGNACNVPQLQTHAPRAPPPFLSAEKKEEIKLLSQFPWAAFKCKNYKVKHGDGDGDGGGGSSDADAVALAAVPFYVENWGRDVSREYVRMRCACVMWIQGM